MLLLTLNGAWSLSQISSCSQVLTEGKCAIYHQSSLFVVHCPVTGNLF